MLALMLAGGGTVVYASQSGGDGDPAPTTVPPATAAGTTTAVVSAETTTPTTPATTGLVAISEPGPLAGEAADVFETYFSGINDGHPEDALSVFDAAGPVDPSDPDQVAQFSHDVSTTHDDDIRLGPVSDQGDSVAARVSFRSHQQRGYGPKDHPNQTCTRWTVDYTLSRTTDGLRIRAGHGRPAAC